MRKIIVPLLLVVLIAGLWLWTRTRPVPVDTALVRRGPIREVVEEEGITRVVERYVVSAPVDGRLRRVALEPGDEVEAGQALAEIDPLPLESRVEAMEAEIRAVRQRIEGVETKKPKPEEIEGARVLEETARQALAVAERELAEAEAARVEAERERQRLQALARRDVVSTQELDEARTAEVQAAERRRARELTTTIRRLEIELATLRRRVLEARLDDFDWERRVHEEQAEGLEASLRALRDDLRRTTIDAPVDGVVLRVHRESEQSVAAGTPILEVGDVGRLEVEVDYLSEDVVRMREGMPAEVFGRAVGETPLAAVVQRIEPSAFRKISTLGVEQQRVNVVLALDATPAGLGDLFRVEARVILASREDALLVDEGALFRLEGRWHAFVVRDGRARLAAVETGLRDGRRREVLGGLEAGDEVILHPTDAIEPGTRVERLTDH